MTIFLVTTAVLVLLAFFIKGNPDLIIKSYMSEEERAGLDMKGLGRLWFYGLILVAVISGGGGLALYLAKLHTFSKVFLFAVIVCGIFVLYLKTRKYCPPSMSRRFNVGIGIFGAVIVGAVFFMVVSAGEPKVEYEEEAVVFTGLYGQKIPYEDVTKMEIRDTLPDLKLRTNGLGLGNILKGHFTTQDSESCILLVNAKYSPYLYIETVNGKKIYFNSKDSALPETVLHEISVRREGSNDIKGEE